jgi:ADP-heptose:LPS heptosyltransferase
MQSELVDGDFGKFIFFNPHSKGEAKFYKKWQEVISLISPELKSKNINIIQVDSLDKEYEGCKKIDNITFNQTAWLMEKSIFLLGIDSFCMHLASSFNKPMLILFGAHQCFNCCKPYFGDPNIQHFFLADLKGNRPTYSYEKGGEYMDQFSPEEVAETFIKILKKHEHIS